MQYIEYGKQNKEIILLLHGGGLSWWNYKEIAELLKNQYHLIIPILNGHSGSDKSFDSIEDNAKDIITFIDEHYNGKVFAIGGLSLGGQILVEMLSQRKDICRFAIIESALVIPKKITYNLISPIFGMSYGLIKQKWFSKLQFNSLKIRNDLFEDYYTDTCKIKKSDMIAFLKGNCNYSLKDSIKETTAKVLITVGAKEQRKMLLSAQKIHNSIKNSKICVLKDFYHGELSINCAKEYINLLDEILKS